MELVAWEGVLAQARVSSIDPKSSETTNLPHLKKEEYTFPDPDRPCMGVFIKGGCPQGWARGEVPVGDGAMLRKRFGLLLAPEVGEGGGRGWQAGAFWEGSGMLSHRQSHSWFSACKITPG